MNFKRLGRVAAISVAGVILLSSCASNEGGSPAASESDGAAALSGDLVGIGASSQQSAQETWVAAFQTANEEVTVSYDPAGSGGGRDAMIAGGTDFAGSDRAFNDDEIAAGGFGACATDAIVELPLYISPIAVIFNLDGIDSLNLDPATLAGIFAGTITSWDAPEIAALNDGVDLPSLAITAVHRSDDSGTSENFTDYLSQTAPDVWTYEPDGVWPIESGEAAAQTSGMVSSVTGGVGTIGYADASRAGDLGTAAIQVGDEFVSYSPEAAAAIVDESPFVEGRAAGDLAIELDRTSDAAGVYPIVLVSYLIACESYEDENTGALVSAYLTYIASDEGQAAAADAAGSAPISSTLKSSVDEAIALIQ